MAKPYNSKQINMEEQSEQSAVTEPRQKPSLKKRAILAGVILLIAAGAVFLKQGTPVTQEQAQQNLPAAVESTVTQEQPENTTQNEQKSYTLEEIATHSSESDCWMAIEGKVYNVSEFVGKHPGGKAILNGCGKDATELFNERPSKDLGPHPEKAREILPTFYIGELKTN